MSRKVTYTIEGMSCGHCAMRVEKALKAVPAVREASVDLDSKEAVITADDILSGETVLKAVEEAGYKAVPPE